ncbi:MAG TPA: hypothetical protein IAB63_04105 [Candidatus Onthocola gallistercoris]|uniref:AB hydrolase-1 domain-containing protein n=1 Tax=Candidatus Onthocola gallistercoris TaxID=2840876 RepID=A0A9D1KX30_9FIRM|nr:hypothetical protein [Candidatus Onthocola gallistercoris]
MKHKKSYWRIIAVSLIVILVMGIISSAVKTDMGNILIRQVKISTRGGTLSGIIYVPKDALENDGLGNYTDKRPAIILSHGYLNSNAMQDPNAIELSRRGFVVFSMDMYGHGDSDLPNATDDPTGTGAVLGALDAYDYVLTLPYVDTTRIGFVAHSMGGMNTGNATALTAGFYTLEDKLLNMLHDELGVEITAEQVAEQDPDAIAAALDDYERGIYETRKAEIEAEHEVRPKGIVFMGSGPGFAALTQAHQVEVAGNTVWRDLQANVGVTIGLYEENAWLMFGANADGINNSSQIPETTLAKSLFETGESNVERRVWYSVNLSDDGEPVQSTILGDFDTMSHTDSTLTEAAANGTLRVLTQPAEIHMMNHFSGHCTAFVVDFYSTVMGYNNGELAEGAQELTSDHQIWLVKEFANGFALAAMFVLVFPLMALLLKTPFFSSLKKKPLEPTVSKRDKGFWITAIALTLIPAITYMPFFMLGGAPTTYAGNKSFVSWSALFSQEMSTRVMIWSVLNGIIAAVVLGVRYSVTGKRQGLTFKEYMGINIRWRDFGKSFLLAGVTFVLTYMTVAISSFFFDYSDMRMWVMAGRVMTKEQFIAWAGYLLFFLFFYTVNGAVVNSGRMKDMSPKKNMVISCIINGAGMILFILLNYVYVLIRGHMVWNDFGQDLFLAVAVIFPIMVILPLAAYYSRKLYEKTGSVLPGACINAMLFTWIVIGNTCFHYSLIA